MFSENAFEWIGIELDNIEFRTLCTIVMETILGFES